MHSPKELSDRLIAAYNAKDFDTLRSLIHQDLDFTHFNRDYVFSNRDDLLAVIEMFAKELVPNRGFEAPERVLECGNTVIREAYYGGSPIADVPGFADAGGTFRLKFCSVMTFNDDGLLVEWKDYG